MHVFNRKFCIVGTGGFAREVLCCLLDIFAAEGVDPEGAIVFLDHENIRKEQELMGIPVIHNADFDTASYQTIVAIANPKTRAFVVQDLPSDTRFTTIVHPSAVISPWVKLGRGSIVTAGVVLTCNISLGAHAHLNLNSTIGHDCVVGDFFTTAPAVSISGNCKIGDRVYFGSNAAIRQGLSVTDDVTVGMGSVVVADVNSSGTYVGVPSRKLS